MSIEIVLSDKKSATFENGGDAYMFAMQHRPYWDFESTRANGRPIPTLMEIWETRHDKKQKDANKTAKSVKTQD